MSSKTRIWVFHMKELIYTLIFAGLGILLIFLLLFMFLPGKEDGESVETMRYVAGVYTSSIQFGEHAVDMQVIVDENRIQSVSMVNLDETVETMYPLMEPALENIADQVVEKQTTEGITYNADYQYTSKMAGWQKNTRVRKSRPGFFCVILLCLRNSCNR